MTGNEQGLYKCIYESIRKLLSQFKSGTCMPDSQIDPRNVSEDIYPDIHIICCWFYCTQSICHEAQKLGQQQQYTPM